VVNQRLPASHRQTERRELHNMASTFKNQKCVAVCRALSKKMRKKSFREEACSYNMGRVSVLQIGRTGVRYVPYPRDFR
jgi:hypothetical protein